MSSLPDPHTVIVEYCPESEYPDVSELIERRDEVPLAKFNTMNELRQLVLRDFLLLTDKEVSLTFHPPGDCVARVLSIFLKPEDLRASRDYRGRPIVHVHNKERPRQSLQAAVSRTALSGTDKLKKAFSNTTKGQNGTEPPSKLSGALLEASPLPTDADSSPNGKFEYIRIGAEHDGTKHPRKDIVCTRSLVARVPKQAFKKDSSAIVFRLVDTWNLEFTRIGVFEEGAEFDFSDPFLALFRLDPAFTRRTRQEIVDLLHHIADEDVDIDMVHEIADKDAQRFEELETMQIVKPPMSPSHAPVDADVPDILHRNRQSSKTTGLVRLRNHLEFQLDVDFQRYMQLSIPHSDDLSDITKWALDGDDTFEGLHCILSPAKTRFRIEVWVLPQAKNHAFMYRWGVSGTRKLWAWLNNDLIQQDYQRKLYMEVHIHPARTPDESESGTEVEIQEAASTLLNAVESVEVEDENIGEEIRVAVKKKSSTKGSEPENPTTRDAHIDDENDSVYSENTDARTGKRKRKNKTKK